MLRRVGGGARPSPWVSQQLAEKQAFQERETKSRIRWGGVGRCLLPLTPALLESLVSAPSSGGPCVVPFC